VANLKHAKRSCKKLKLLEVQCGVGFLDLLSKRIRQAKESGGCGVLLMVEIRNLSLVTSIYGASYSEKVIKNLYNDFKKTFGKKFVIYRASQRFFMVICPKTTAKESKIIIEKIHKFIQLHTDKDYDNAPHNLNPNIGAIVFPNDSEQPEALIEKAYIALKNVRHDLDRYYFHYEDFKAYQSVLKNQMEMAHRLKRAMLEDRLRLAYQPVIDTKTREIVYYECLLRLVEGDEIISAGPFIPIAEKLLFIDLIDEIVLEKVVKEVKNSKNIKFSFNLSALGIYNEEWQRRAERHFSDPEIASRVVIEITETSAQRDLVKSANFIKKLKSYGCKVAIDDFGAGYTSFKQLQVLPVDTIKIDGTFIRDIDTNKNSLLFVKTLLKMNKAMGFTTVAEFVENKAIADILSKLGVDLMQGFYFSPPLNERPWKKT
jgi:EAL domain-containing protein (putative c-di-GMP-specific phosphodiesterase class I)/GGDEF domain-containing protein